MRWPSGPGRRLLSLYGWSRHGNILVAGSFDRDKHNEERKKGHWRIYEGEVDKVVHIENKHAAIYHTINCGDLDAHASMDFIDKACIKFKDVELS